MQSINKTVSGVCFFFGFYFFLEQHISYIFPFPASKTPSLLTRYVSFLHGLFVSICTTLYLLDILSFYWWDQFQYIIISYCIYDTLMMFGNVELYKKMDRFMPLHHLLLACFAGFFFPYYPYEVSIGYLAEWSNPIIHACYHMIHTPHQEHTNILFLLKICLMFSFFFFRICNFTYLLWLAVSNLHFSGGICTSVLVGMNIWWFIKLCRMFWAQLLSCHIPSPHNNLVRH